jgi:hypothetical protein
MAKRLVGAFALLVAAGGPAWAQLISIKTVPVAQADQFAIFPSERLGMGSVSIALADPLLDPFTNPAKGARVETSHFFGSPVFYNVSSNAGGGRTLPLAGLARSGSWFGGMALALQEVAPARRNQFVTLPAGDVLTGSQDVSQVISTQARGNELAFAMIGKALPRAGLSLGGSVFWAGLRAVDGVDLLYAGSRGIRQFGHAIDVRLGLTKDWEGDRSLEALVLYDRFRMTHDVAYLDAARDAATLRTVLQPRLERNLDWTDVWGLHLEYERPLYTTGWRIGWLATVNRMSHPKIPNYEIMSIPRDPGYSNAFNLGIGLSNTHGPATFGIDAIYEPIWSNTWANAESPTATRLGSIIPAGGKTIENDFRFSNAMLRMGVSRDIGKTTGYQLGLVLRSIHYWLRQVNNVEASVRDLEEGWVEWTPTWGLVLRFPEMELRYQGLMTNGTGRPGVASTVRGAGLDVAAAGNQIIVAPSGPLTLEGVRVMTHRVGLSLPLGRGERE